MRTRAVFLLVLMALPVWAAKPKIAKLSKKLLYGDQETRMEAVKAFNKLPMDAQYELVPDFMVAMSDDNPEVRKVASRILKAMGVKAQADVPDARMEPPPPPASKEADQHQLADVKKDLPPTPPPSAAAADPWADLKSVRGDTSGNYADLRAEMDREKKGQVALDLASLQSDSPTSLSPLSTVVESLKDPTPWVRAQAARRLSMIHPAPTETIPTLMEMLGDKDVECRRAAAAALGSFGPLAREAAPALTKALSDPDDNVSLIAAEALKQIQQSR